MQIIMDGRPLSCPAAHVQVTKAMYFVIVGVCAPVWEEAIFRGFLLPSFGRWMPVPGAIAASAFIFALAHLQGAHRRSDYCSARHC